MRYFFAPLLLMAFHFTNAQVVDSATGWKIIDRTSYTITYPGSWRVDTSKIVGAR